MSALNRLTIEVAGRSCGFEAEDPAWVAALEPRYGAFRSDRDPDFVLRLDPLPAPEDAAELSRLTAEPVELTVAPGSGGRTVTLHSDSISGWLDVERGRGHLAAPVHRHAVDVAVRTLLVLAVPDSLLVHGALIAHAGHVYLAAGPSGSGKSTLARLLAARALCDELALLERENGHWRAHALPFWHGRPGGGPLVGIRLLTHAESHRCSRVEAAEATRRLAAEIVWPTFSPEHADAALELLGRLVAEVPVSELGFAPRADVWPVLVAGASSEVA